MAGQPPPPGPPPAGKGKGPLGKLDNKQKVLIGGGIAVVVAGAALLHSRSAGSSSASGSSGSDTSGGSDGVTQPAIYTGGDYGDTGSLDDSLAAIQEELAQIVAHENPPGKPKPKKPKPVKHHPAKKHKKRKERKRRSPRKGGLNGGRKPHKHRPKK